MTVKHVWMVFMLGAVVAACTKDTGGSVTNPTPVAGLRYFNAVSDTGPVDFRVVDIVGYAPNQVQASFRTGGLPSGISTNFVPPYQAVEAGTRHIRVFLDDTISIATASTILLDTTFNFVAGGNYTFYLYGSARTPPLKALITTDSTQNLAAGKIAVRVLDLAADLSGNAAGSAATTIGAQVGPTTSVVPVPTAVTATLAYGAWSPYTVLDSSGTATPYRLAVTAGGTTSPILFQATMPVGVRGTTTANPIAGTAVQGTAITALILPRSTPGSTAPQSSPTAVTTKIDSVTRIADTAVVWRSVAAGNGTTTCASATAAGVNANDILAMTGLTPVDYNGAHAVVAVTAAKSQNVLQVQSVTLSNTTAGASYRLILAAGDTTAAITWDADSAVVRAALSARTTIKADSNVGVAGSPGGPYTVTFKGILANASVATMTAVATQSLGVAIAVQPVACAGTASAARIKYRIATAPVSPATGAASFKVVTATNEYKAPSIIFLIDQQPVLTSP